jgi:hypothetical protein
MGQQTINEQGGLIILNPLQIADENTYNLAMDVIEADDTIRSAEDFVKVNKGVPANFIMEPVHTLERPIMVDRDHIALLWRDKDDPSNVDMMAAVILELVERGDGTFRKVPCGVIAGNDFQGILQYRCPCCGDNQSGFSMMFFLKNEKGETEYTTRDTVVTKLSKAKLFESVPQGITVSSSQIQHILHHHENFGRACGHDHSHLPRNVEQQKLSLGLK